ncbi:hypothetical protein Tco_1435622 [Tanacetum coccineum]
MSSSKGVHVSLVPPGSYDTRQQQQPLWLTRVGHQAQMFPYGFQQAHMCTKQPSVDDPTWNMDTGDGKTIHVTKTGHSILPTLSHPLYLHNVLVTPNIIKNLIYVRQFTRDNKCTIEFDEFGFSVKDFLTRHILFRCDSPGDLYPVTKPSLLPNVFLSVSPTMWH